MKSQKILSRYVILSRGAAKAWSVSTGWGCGAIVAAIVTILVIVIISSALGL
jgi:hypothetical protein